MEALDSYLPDDQDAAEPIGLKDFVERTVTFKLHEWQAKHLCPLLERLRSERGLRLAIHGPPQYGKSVVVSQRTPAYLIGCDPNSRNGLACYNETHAAGFGAVVKDILLSPDFIEMFPDPGCRIAKDAPSGRFSTVRRQRAADAQPSFLALGLNSGFVGKGLDNLFIDDPYKSAEEARSETINNRVWRWWDETASPRLPDTTNVVVMFHRYAEDDFAGRLLAQGGWEYIRFPAIADDNEDGSDPTGRTPGELLSPMRSREWLEKQEATSPLTFLGQFQGTPKPAQGIIFREEWFRARYKSLPQFVEVYTLWDTALKDKEQNDETACLTLGVGANGFLYILRALHGRWETPDVARFLCDQADWLKKLYGDTYRGDYVEDKVSGTTLMQYVRRTRPDLALIPVLVEADKVARAHGVTPLCETERVLFPDPDIFPQASGWTRDVIEQLLGFPLGKHDDIVDVFVYALKRFLGTLRTAKKGEKQKAANRRGGMA